MNDKAWARIKIAGKTHAEPLTRTKSWFVPQLSMQQVSQGTVSETFGVELAGLESFPQPADFL